MTHADQDGNVVVENLKDWEMTACAKGDEESPGSNVHRKAWQYMRIFATGWRRLIFKFEDRTYAIFSANLARTYWTYAVSCFVETNQVIDAEACRIGTTARKGSTVRQHLNRENNM